jgi:hypothetical protein
MYRVGMNRANLYFWSTLHARQHGEDVSPSDVADQTLRDLYFADRAERQAEMEAAIGLWAERSELSDAENYLRILREDDRSARLLPR